MLMGGGEVGVEGGKRERGDGRGGGGGRSTGKEGRVLWSGQQHRIGTAASDI